MSFVAAAVVVGGVALAGGLAASGALDPSAPNPMRYGGQLHKNLLAQEAVAPERFADESTWQPQYADLALQIQGQTRQGNLNQVSSLTPQMRAVMRSYNPQTAALLDQVDNQAQQQLALNGALDPWTQRAVQQYARQGQAARGMGYGPGDAMMEAQYEGQTTEQRRAQNQQFAQGVAAQEQQFYGDPFAHAAQLTGTQQEQALFNPESNYAKDIYMTNYNADAAARIAAANINAGLIGGAISGAGKAGGAIAAG